MITLSLPEREKEKGTGITVASKKECVSEVVYASKQDLISCFSINTVSSAVVSFC